MFAKQAAKRPEKGLPAAPALSSADTAAMRRPPKVASVIADDLSLEGGVTGDGELHVDGRIKGDIRIGRLTLGETGHIEGNVYAETVEARGRIIGSITANSPCASHSSAKRAKLSVALASSSSMIRQLA